MQQEASVAPSSRRREGPAGQSGTPRPTGPCATLEQACGLLVGAGRCSLGLHARARQTGTACAQALRRCPKHRITDQSCGFPEVSVTSAQDGALAGSPFSPWEPEPGQKWCLGPTCPAMRFPAAGFRTALCVSSNSEWSSRSDCPPDTPREQAGSAAGRPEAASAQPGSAVPPVLADQCLWQRCPVGQGLLLFLLARWWPLSSAEPRRHDRSGAAPVLRGWAAILARGLGRAESSLGRQLDSGESESPGCAQVCTGWASSSLPPPDTGASLLSAVNTTSLSCEPSSTSCALCLSRRGSAALRPSSSSSSSSGPGSGSWRPARRRTFVLAARAPCRPSAGVFLPCLKEWGPGDVPRDGGAGPAGSQTWGRPREGRGGGKQPAAQRVTRDCGEALGGPGPPPCTDPHAVWSGRQTVNE